MNGSQAVSAASFDLATKPFSKSDQHLIANGLPWAEAPWPMTGYPHEVIDRFCQSDPDRTVILATNDDWSRKRLKQTSDAIAHALVARGVGVGDVVVVVLPKSAMAIAAILGVWKSGGAFVPVDPLHPETRNRHVLSDCGARFAVTSRDGLASLGNHDLEAVLVEDVGTEEEPKR